MIEVTPPGKKRGYFRARFRTNTGQILAAAATKRTCGLEDAKPMAKEVVDAAEEDCVGNTEIIIDVLPPTRAEETADEVLTLRKAGVKWKEIRSRFRCGFATARRAYEIAKARLAG